MSEYCKNCRLLQKTINELEERAEEYYELNEKLIARVEELTAAPIDNGIPELDAFCQQFNDGKFDLTDLVCRIWNSQQAKVEEQKKEIERLKDNQNEDT